mmetsp:Transcript_82485/g.143338  ORF Transcript_82485/g.143338 Transcript_82485/m.143338 type:complete len:103 (+) Transcript_82485:158-466(+)
MADADGKLDGCSGPRDDHAIGSELLALNPIMYAATGLEFRVEFSGEFRGETTNGAARMGGATWRVPRDAVGPNVRVRDGACGEKAGSWRQPAFGVMPAARKL